MALNLRSPLRDCQTRKHVSAGGADAGDIVKEQEQLGIVAADITATEEGALIISSPKAVIAKKTGVTIARGDLLYWDTTAETTTNVSATGLYKCGFANEAAASGASTIEVQWDGNLSQGTAES